MKFVLKQVKVNVEKMMIIFPKFFALIIDIYFSLWEFKYVNWSYVVKVTQHFRMPLPFKQMLKVHESDLLSHFWSHFLLAKHPL